MKKSHKPSSLFHTFNNAFFQIKVLIVIACLFLIGNSAFAAASCPSGQRLYYVGAAAPTTAYKITSGLLHQRQPTNHFLYLVG